MNVVKKVTKYLLPPILTDAIRETRIRLGLLRPGLEYDPRGWQTILDDSDTKGWGAKSVAEAERSKWKIFCKNCEGQNSLGFSHEHQDPFQTGGVAFHNDHITYAYVLALIARKRDFLSVLDWGGALGHYYQIGRAVLPDIYLDFHCKEVPLLAQLGKELNPSVTWYQDESCLLRQYHLVMMNGSLTCLEDWKGYLKKITAAVGEYFYLTRQAVLQKSKSFVAIQRVYDTEMSHWQINKKELLSVVESNGLKLIREFVAGDKPWIYKAPEQCELAGFLFKR